MIPDELSKLMGQFKINVKRIDRKAAENALADLNIPIDSEFAEFFLTYLTPPCRSKLSDEVIYDIADPTPEIVAETRFVHDVWDIPDNYICFTSTEGEGAYLYDIKTGKIWDFALVNRTDFLAGKIKPRWNGFFEFLIWYLRDIEK
ncbi:MAG: SMI1/KNR4 family protein [Gammaproteobacteria bacterium]|nr:SMI1/KNR4 family protein [Gammaproteobacteria bacterium]